MKHGFTIIHQRRSSKSKQWIAAGEIAAKKAETVASAGKVMATVFIDSQGVMLTDYLGKVGLSPDSIPLHYWSN